SPAERSPRVDGFSICTRSHSNRKRTLGLLRGLVESAKLGARRMGCGVERCGAAHLSQYGDRPLVRRRDLRLKYVELHAASAFSFLEGASAPESLAAGCSEYGIPAMALLDRDGVYGSVRFHQAAKKLGLTAHVGAEYSVPGTAGTILPLLAETRDGYR